jgi:hypothetical protein
MGYGCGVLGWHVAIVALPNAVIQSQHSKGYQQRVSIIVLWKLDFGFELVPGL